MFSIFRKSGKPISEMRPSQVEQMEEQKKEDGVDVSRLRDQKIEYETHHCALKKIVAYCEPGYDPAYHANALKKLLAEALVKRI